MVDRGTHTEWRNNGQHILPVTKCYCCDGKYDIYPSHKIADNQIFIGFDSLAEFICKHKTVVIDTFSGVFSDLLKNALDTILSEKGFSAYWIFTAAYFKPGNEIRKLIQTYDGGDDPLFGKRCTLYIEDFFLPGALRSAIPDPDADICLIIGPGASLAGGKGSLIYVDVPKNEIQFRSRAASITNLGIDHPGDPREMYKRFYFIDRPVLNRARRTESG